MTDGMGQAKLVVAHFKDGTLLKGYTNDFSPPSRIFTIVSVDNTDNITQVNLVDLKALFFVKTFEGNKYYNEKIKFDEIKAFDLKGLKVKVVFNDGEIIRGTISDYRNIFTGFYLKPLDPNSNNDTVYVLSESPLDIAIGSMAEK
jgi:hypothetical protein